MEFTDPQEARTLQQRYAQMTDDELQAIAEEGYELTEAAQQTLQSEIRQRRLDIKLKDAPATLPPPDLNPSPNDFDPSDLDLTVFRRVWDQAEAIEVKRILNESGVPCYLGPDNLEDVNAFNINFEKGVDLKVRYIDQPRAMGAISHSFDSDHESEPEVITEASVRCPKCNSDEVVFQSRDSQSGEDPDFYSKFNWSCDACGHKWTDDGVEKEA